jgi:hypothetical protein
MKIVEKPTQPKKQRPRKPQSKKGKAKKPEGDVQPDLSQNDAEPAASEETEEAENDTSHEA